jgi:hypothetical protein
MLELYYAVIHPHMLCNIIAWGKADQNTTCITKTKILQKRQLE